METRQRKWLPWALVVPGLMLAGCGDDPTPVPTRDTGAEFAADVEPDEDVPSVPQDTGRDVTRPDAIVDVPLPKDTAEDDTPDAGDDVSTLDAGDDVSTLDAGKDVILPDVDEDASTPDAGKDVTTPDVTTPDVTTPDVTTPDVTTPDAGGTCPFPTERALTLPTDSVMATLSGPNRITAACTSVGGPDHIYPLHVAARTGLMLSTTASFDSVLMLRRVCNSTTGEVACNDDAPGSLNSYIRRVVDPGDYYVVVDQYGTSGTGGAYTLRVASFTPAAHSECATAAALTAGTAVTGNTTTGGAASSLCLTDQWGGQLFYSLTIPPGQRATVTATPTGTPAWRAVVRAQSTCTATSCLASGVSTSPGAAASEVIDNRGTTPLTVTVSVASSTPSEGGTFSLSAAFSALPTPPAHATCAMARAVTHGTTLTNENASLGTTRLDSVCVAGAQGTSLFYRVTVPSRATLEFDATPVGSWDPVIRLLNACGAAGCLASIDRAGSGSAETLRWLNTAATSQEVYAAVSSYSATVSGSFNGAVRVVPPPTNTTCRAAITVTSDTPIATQNAAAGVENATAACLPSATGTVLYYAVRVPAGYQLSASVEATAGVDPVIRVLDSCDATACLASANATGTGGAESVIWTNSGAERTVYLAVGGNTNATNGSIPLSVNVRREYTVTAIPRACDDMTGATALTGVSSDDSSTELLDLPFAFTFYGERALEYSVSSNGFLQLWPNLMSTPNNNFSNTNIPNTAPPNRFVAPFWDDLYPVAASMGSPASSVLTRTLGSAPNRRFVVQWTNFTFYDDRSAQVTFQARLFEGSNAIEFHYCTLTPGTAATRVTGDSATVGIENADGRAGVQYAYNRAGAVSTTSAIRFTP